MLLEVRALWVGRNKSSQSTFSKWRKKKIPTPVFPFLSLCYGDPSKHCRSSSRVTSSLNHRWLWHSWVVSAWEIQPRQSPGGVGILCSLCSTLRSWSSALLWALGTLWGSWELILYITGCTRHSALSSWLFICPQSLCVTIFTFCEPWWLWTKVFQGGLCKGNKEVSNFPSTALWECSSSNLTSLISPLSVHYLSMDCWHCRGAGFFLWSFQLTWVINLDEGFLTQFWAFSFLSISGAFSPQNTLLFFF